MDTELYSHTTVFLESAAQNKYWIPFSGYDAGRCYLSPVMSLTGPDCVNGDSCGGYLQLLHRILHPLEVEGASRLLRL